jgi:hypothetical protein
MRLNLYLVVASLVEVVLIQIWSLVPLLAPPVSVANIQRVRRINALIVV